MPDTNPPSVTPRPETTTPATQERKPRRWVGRLIGLVALAAAVAVAVIGILDRQESDQKVGQWTHQQAIPSVAVVMPKGETAPPRISLPGDIEAYFQAPIYAQVNGYIKVWYKDIGDWVKAGDILAVIETPELDQQLDQAKADLLTAQTNQKLAEITAKRWVALLKSNAVSVQATDEKTADAAAKAALTQAAEANVQRIEALLAFRNLVAPFDGVVTQRHTDIGALVSAHGSTTDHELFAVADIHRMRIYVRVPQVYSADITNGMTAELKLPQYPNRVFTAVVATTANAIDPKSRTVLVQLQADNAKGELWPGTYAQVIFHLPPNRDALFIPASALIFQEHGAEVATVGPDNKVVLKKVHIGRDDGTRLEILQGITAQDRVINSPPDTLTEGETVRVMPNAHDSNNNPPETAHQ
ncbi:efflux RND transporter periplasmic adaptor subunit [Acidisphaera rubrifaciens]|uniref:Multidrug resistance efflux pump n=1 Tax=Acidisphaera rubrifaciens HS-AP3 TaxID=1231350 RepID=A0A0D6P943_9PROT|nr:efflux RND transporter periplasmic adaptor subunit [Acidisphaera rubrifaciens]GAN77384.1 multidrug resistance efflux pump [Acidisphaera rubrifaciens HS-AP3]